MFGGLEMDQLAKIKVIGIGGGGGGQGVHVEGQTL